MQLLHLLMFCCLQSTNPHWMGDLTQVLICNCGSSALSYPKCGLSKNKVSSVYRKNFPDWTYIQTHNSVLPQRRQYCKYWCRFWITIIRMKPMGRDVKTARMLQKCVYFRQPRAFFSFFLLPFRMYFNVTNWYTPNSQTWSLKHMPWSFAVKLEVTKLLFFPSPILDRFIEFFDIKIISLQVLLRKN